MGPFEEEEEGTGVDSDVPKVQGEDPAHWSWQNLMRSKHFYCTQRSAPRGATRGAHYVLGKVH